jgi:hypothetical protein
MTVRRTDDAIALAGDCPVEDAELLLGLLVETPTAIVDVGGCGRVHTAVAQVLLAARPAVRGTPDNALLSDWILPQLLDATDENNSRMGEGRSS